MTGSAATPRRVVLVDDEEALAWSLASRLAKIRPHIQVVTAHEGNAALALMQPGVDLLVADIRMPGISGIDLVLTARQTRPDLAVIVMTAFPSADAHRLYPGPFTGFLEKPFEFDRLLELVDKALEPPKVGFSGAISVSTLPDIVQLYVLSSATGQLSIKHHTGEGQVWFVNGAIAHARTRDEVGDEAFYEIMMWSGGEFLMRARRARAGAVDAFELARAHHGELPMTNRRTPARTPAFAERLDAGAPRLSRRPRRSARRSVSRFRVAVDGRRRLRGARATNANITSGDIDEHQRQPCKTQSTRRLHRRGARRRRQRHAPGPGGRRGSISKSPRPGTPKSSAPSERR